VVWNALKRLDLKTSNQGVGSSNLSGRANLTSSASAGCHESVTSLTFHSTHVETHYKKGAREEGAE